MDNRDRSETARILVAARREDRVLDAYPGPVPKTLSGAYAIQDEAIALRAAPVAGWKLGRVGDDELARHRVERLVGPIFADQVFCGERGEIVEVPVLSGFAAVEAELVLRLGRTMVGAFSIADVPDYISEVRFGLEIASSPLPFINERGPAVTASDFGNNYGLVLGPRLDGWRSGEVLSGAASMTIDGQLAGEGRPSAILDGPFGSVAFLAGALAKRGRVLEAGSWVSAGAITGVHPIAPGQIAEAVLAGEFTVRCVATSSLHGVGNQSACQVRRRHAQTGMTDLE